MSTVLVDTDILIHLLRGVQKAKAYLEAAAREGAVLCSAIAVAEIYAGMREREREKTDALLDSMEIVDVTKSIARKAGFYKASVKGRGLELDDCIVAATAFATKAVLVTGNGKDYPMSDIRKDVVVF